MLVQGVGEDYIGINRCRGIKGEKILSIPQFPSVLDMHNICFSKTRANRPVLHSKGQVKATLREVLRTCSRTQAV